MTHYELAINEDGEPFSVPDKVTGWRPRRVGDGRGRPTLVHHTRGPQKGKPLVLRVDASHEELLGAAGPGKYRRAVWQQAVTHNTSTHTSPRH
ncbi:MAG: hypothetical protein ACREBE_14050 [bacterium]